MLATARLQLKKVLPDPAYQFLRVFRPKDAAAGLAFLGDRGLGLSFVERVALLRRLYAVSFGVESPHTQAEILSHVRTILSLPRGGRGVVVEAGCFKGSSTAKFSLAAAIAGRRLLVFDSFQGIPHNDEPHDRRGGGATAKFKAGQYRGSLDEVRGNVARFGRIDCCTFVPGWFDDTMTAFREPVAAAYIDVDLASSTKTCLKYLYPLLEPNGVLYSQDGHLPLVVDVFDDDDFWLREVGCSKPEASGLGESKLLRVVKPA